MTWRVNEVDEEPIAVLLLGDVLHVTFVQLIVHGDSTEVEKNTQRGQK